MTSEIRPRHDLSAWMELDYFRRRRLFRGWHLRLCGVAAVAGALLVVGGVLGWGRRTFHAGPLSSPHALLDRDCGVCHQNHFHSLARLWPGSSAVSVPDSACQNCHAGSHHNDLSRMDSCVTCHKEHRGHRALVRVDDRHCTSCHGDLESNSDSPPRTPDYGPKVPYANRVVSFAADESDHPDFRRRHGNEGRSPDPGTIRFNHAVHLAAEGVRDIDAAQFEKQFEEIRQKGLDPGTLVVPSKQTVLACADCHTLDAEGRYLEPISYTRHCQKCHPLSIQIVGAWKDPKQQRLAWDFARTAVRHPSRSGSPRDVRAALRQRLAEYIRDSKGQVFLPGAVPAARPLPDRDPPGGKLSKEQYAWVNHHLKQTEHVLFHGGGGCRYCHTQKSPPTAATDGLPVLARSGIPRRWWEHATFRHTSHRMLDCAECHDAKNSKSDRDVLLPGKDNCLKCHDARATLSARADCVQCHGYHDPKLQRRARQEGRLSIDRVRGR